MSARCHAPWGIASTPGMMRGVTRTATTSAPRSFSTTTRSPATTPRRCASRGFICISWGETAASSSTLPYVECVRWRQW